MSQRDLTLQQRARELRKEPTATEELLWTRLRKRQMDGHKFRRQQVLGSYIVDFVCLEKKLVIELDGGQHAERLRYDQRRTRWLEQHGFRVLRFWDNQVFMELEAVLRVIEAALACPPPLSSPTPPP